MRPSPCVSLATSLPTGMPRLPSRLPGVPPGPGPGRRAWRVPATGACRLGLGTLHAKAGQRRRARAGLARPPTLYRAIDMTFWLPQAEAMLAQVSE